MSRVVAALLLLLLSLSLAAQTISISPESPIAPPVTGPPAAVQDEPLVASNGDGFLVAWTQRSHGADVYAARVTAFGEVADPTGIPVATLGIDEQLLAIFADGRDFLVVWQTAQGVRYAAVDAEGAVGPATALVPEFLAFGVVGWDGAEFVIVESYGGEIVTRHVNRGGELVSRTSIHGPAAPVWAIATLRAGGALAVFSDGSSFEYYLARIDGHAPPVLAALGGGDVGAPRLTVSDRSVLVTGRTQGAMPHAFLADLELTSVRELSLPATAPIDYPVGAVGTTAGHRVYVMSGAALRRLEISDAGLVSGAGEPLLQVEGRLAAAASAGHCDFLAFVPPIPVSGWAPIVRGATVCDGRASLVHEGGALTKTASEQRAPMLASDGRDYVAIWSEQRGDLAPPTQWSAAITAAGVASTAAGVSAGCHALSFDGRHRVALCREDGGALQLRRVSGDGSVDAAAYASVAVSASSSEYQLECGSGDCIVAWREGPVVELAVVAPSGALLARLGIPPLPGLGRGVRDVRLAYEDGVYLVIWSQIMNAAAPPYWSEPLDLYGIRVDGRGALVDGAPFVVASTASDEHEAAIAGGDGAFVVVWTAGTSILGARIAAGDPYVHPEPVLLCDGRAPSIARVRSDFLLAWEQRSAAGDTGSSSVAVGVLTGSGPLAVRVQSIAAGGASDEFSPVIGTTGSRAILLYQRVAHEPEVGGVTRVFARSVATSSRVRPARP